ANAALRFVYGRWHVESPLVNDETSARSGGSSRTVVIIRRHSSPTVVITTSRDRSCKNPDAKIDCVKSQTIF
ncbi:MAG TPA: hypothetical protein VGM90_37850, partial [Kofleriaceae bacterium]